MTDDRDDRPRGAGRPEGSAVLAELQASAARRVIGTAIIAALAGLLIYLALWRPPEAMLWQVFLLLFGGFAVFAAVRLWQDTRKVLELTSLELREKGGRVLAPVAEMRSVSRAAFAMKPSNGFSVELGRSLGFGWAPGLWWRLGKKIGVGGITSSRQARHMADQIAALIAARAG